jgi:hypothetical protein
MESVRVALSLSALVVVTSFGANLLVDRANCFVGRCLTKHRAYQMIYLGTPASVAEDLLNRAGVQCAEFGANSCEAVTFSDFWRDYLVHFRTGSENIVDRKSFRFRNHGRGIYELLRPRRSEP